MNINIDFDNPSVRLPLAFVLDTSGSMEWDNPKPIDLLNEGLKHFKEEIEKDEVALMALEVALINCGEKVEVIKDFENAYNLNFPKLSAAGGTPLGQAIELAVKSLSETKELYNQSGIQYYQPMLVLMTDGFATDDTSNAINLVKNLCNNRKLTVVNIAIGNSADCETLKKFHPNNEVTTINKLEMKDFFRWLSESVKVVSNNNGERITKSYNDWNQ